MLGGIRFINFFILLEIDFLYKYSDYGFFPL